MYPIELRDHIVRPTLKRLGLWSLAAEQLLIGTIFVESNGRHLKQINGPAMGIIQMEPSTHADIWRNFLEYRQHIASSVVEIVSNRYYTGLDHPCPTALINSLDYAVAMCRIYYLRISEPLPAAGDVHGMAKYWKEHYNTHIGRGTISDFMHRFPSEILKDDD